MSLSTEGVMTDPQMVVCRICNLLVGWSEQKVDFVCIPCFDSVRIVRSQDTPGSQGKPA